MSINHFCKNCSGSLESEDEDAGEEVACPFCNTVIQIPTVSLAREINLPKPKPAPKPKMIQTPAVETPNFKAVSRRKYHYDWTELVYRLVIILSAELMIIYVMTLDTQTIFQQIYYELVAAANAIIAVMTILIPGNSYYYCESCGNGIKPTSKMCPSCKLAIR